jgi:serine/threonine-protein kinase
MRHASNALLLEPNEDVAGSIGQILLSNRIGFEVASDGKEGWQKLASRRPDVVLLELDTPGLDLFHRRLRDEYLGARPRLVALASVADLKPGVSQLDLDAVILKPIAADVLLSAVNAGQGYNTPVVLDPGRLREMLRLSILGSDFQVSLDGLAHRLVLVYGANNCIVLANSSEKQWVGTVGEPIPGDEWPGLWRACDEAVSAGAPLFAVREDVSVLRPDMSKVETRLAAPISSPAGDLVGAICLFTNLPRLYTSEARDALKDLATRIGVELSWRSIHDRVSVERDRLRENVMLDPTLGILSRAALEQALALEIARYDRSKEPLSVGVMDIRGLRLLNDRFGHVAGDAALKHVADVTRRIVRAQDVVARYGGDEIAIVLSSTPIPGAASLLDRVRRSIEAEPFSAPDGQKITVRVGIGVTAYITDDDDGATTLSRAAQTASAANRRGGSIAIADSAPKGTATNPNMQIEGFASGATLGGMYQIVHEISRGAMGVVYRAEDLGLGRPVAVKMLRPDLGRDRQLIQRFREEAGILAQLNHQNLVRVYSFIEDRDDVFFVMELVEGVSLDGLIAEMGEDTYMEPPKVATIVSQVASALDAMHEAGVMHRDVKPGNVVIDRARDRAVLVDVGLAKKVGSRSDPAGTPGFIAPESFRGGPESPATDVYGLAATTYTLMANRAPFGRSDDYKIILQRQLDERPPRIGSYRNDVLPEVDDVILRGLAVDHDRRYSNAGEFARALARALGSTSHGYQAPSVAGFYEDDEDDDDDYEGSTLVHVPELSPEAQAALSELRPKENRTLTLILDTVPPAKPREPDAMTRGVVFRGAGRVLGLKTASAWARTVAKTNTELADAMSLRTSPLAWLPADLFQQMLAAVTESGRDASDFGKQLGGVVVAQTFQRFYPSSPESLSPTSTLSALDVLWRRYHTWGTLTSVESDPNHSIVGYDGPKDAAICAFTQGWLEQIVTLSGGKTPTIEHTSCKSRGDAACNFDVNWQ